MFHKKIALTLLCWTLLLSGAFLYAGPAYAEDVQAAEVDTSALGDLSGYKALANDVITALKDKDADKAKSKISEIETAWTKDEKTLSAQSPKAWDVVNKAFTQAAALVKATEVDFDKAKEAMDAYVKTITK